MKTLILSMSPRNSFSASMYFSKILKFFMESGEVEILQVKTNKQYLNLESKLDKVDNLVFVTPVYVDTIPSTVLDKLVKIENYSKDKNLNLNIYTLINCGFYESSHCELAQKTFKLFCDKCNFNFKGGLSIGSGVMVAFIRTLIPIGIFITIFETLLIGIFTFINTGSLTFNDLLHFPSSLVVQTILYILWSMGLFINSFKLSRQIDANKTSNVIYTGLWFCPRFLFVIIASIYWIIASIFWYKGKFWDLLKEPNIKC